MRVERSPLEQYLLAVRTGKAEGVQDDAAVLFNEADLRGADGAGPEVRVLDVQAQHPQPPRSSLLQRDMMRQGPSTSLLSVTPRCQHKTASEAC